MRVHILAATLLLSGITAMAQTRINFAPGATRATVQGNLKGINDEAVYLVGAKTGQHLRVEIKGKGATRGSVTFPSGKSDGGPGGVVFEGTVPETGDCRIRVTESSMAETWAGSFNLIVDLTPKATTAPSSGAKLANLESYVGKYPSDLFKGVPSVKTRLRTLLGPNYNAFLGRLQTQVPIENDSGALVVRGCKAHDCTVEEAILVIKLDDDTLHCAIMRNSTWKTYTKSPTVPPALTRAMKQGKS
jgi:hypothetical protein